MTVQDAIELRERLEQAVAEQVAAFEAATGLVVSSLVVLREGNVTVQAKVGLW